MFSLKTVLLLATSLALVSAEGEKRKIIGNRHPDPNCMTRIYDPVYDGACIDLGHGSINFYETLTCTSFSEPGCKGAGYPVLQPEGCLKLEGLSGSLRCFAH